MSDHFEGARVDPYLQQPTRARDVTAELSGQTSILFSVPCLVFNNNGAAGDAEVELWDKKGSDDATITYTVAALGHAGEGVRVKRIFAAGTTISSGLVVHFSGGEDDIVTQEA